MYRVVLPGYGLYLDNYFPDTLEEQVNYKNQEAT